MLIEPIYTTRWADGVDAVSSGCLCQLPEVGPHPGNGLKTEERQQVTGALFYVFLQWLLDELEVRVVIGAIVQPDIELAAGTGPGFVCLPYISVGV